ncbi:MAG: DUF1365 domain-containing protein [Methylococcales bacterium]
MNALNSRLYDGWIRHRRYSPKAHAFRYPLFMTWLDLDEIDQVMAQSRFWSLGRFNLVSFYRKDYLGDETEALPEAVKARIAVQTGEAFSGKICQLAHLRFLGYCFNPVSFYFCYPDGSSQPRFILADINNTPWDERFCYVLDTRDSPEKTDKWTFTFNKAFHVSPFMPMDLTYRWTFSLQPEHFIIHMQLWQAAQRCFDATLQLQPNALNRRSMLGIPLRFPFMTLSVVGLIYWQALRLWLKGIPFFSHPQT